jgi:hypothetical protein
MPETSQLSFRGVFRELRPHALWHAITWIAGLLFASVISPLLFLLWQKLHHASFDWYVVSFLFAASLLAFVVFAVFLFLLAARMSKVPSQTQPASDSGSLVPNTALGRDAVGGNHEREGSDPDVRFWHCVANREAHRQDVRTLISGSRLRVIITGIGLQYLVKYCAAEMQTALSKGTLIGIVIAKPTRKSFDFYARYSRDIDQTLPTTHGMYRTFAAKLDRKQSECFALYHTDVPLTHSIGLYDNAMYISELCIDHSSSNCPSFSPPPGSTSHSLFLGELKQLLTESRLIDGSAHAKLLGDLE